MRTVSFSDPKIQQKLTNEFVCAWTSTVGDPSAGRSIRHTPNEPAGPCLRGNGQQNMQLLFLTQDGKIFHTVSGYIDAADLLEELEFASKLHAKIKGQPLERQKQIVRATQQKKASTLDRNANRRSNASMFPQGSMLDEMAARTSSMRHFPEMGSFIPNISFNGSLRDNRFCADNPMIEYQEFDRDPTGLIGNGTSFFASKSVDSLDHRGMMNNGLILNGFLPGMQLFGDQLNPQNQNKNQPTPQPNRRRR